MSDGAAADATTTTLDSSKAGFPPGHDDEKKYRNSDAAPENIQSPTSPRLQASPFAFQRRTSLDIDDYFTGPRDITKHSKWPIFLRMHGSIVPKMILPLTFVAAWATAITVISNKVHPLGVQSVLLTILGFVVGLGLSFRNSTAYERYAEGRKYWAMLVLASQVLGRVFWIHSLDKPGADARESLLQKLSSMNLLVAFAVALKHSLRFEPYTAYPDLQNLVGHLNTFAKAATDEDASSLNASKKNFFKEVGEYLGVSFAASNPRKTLKRASRPLGNLPLEILNHIAVTIDCVVRSEQLKVPMQQTLAYNNLSVLNDVMTGCERVLNTPLPIAYTIAISQITWVYVMLLPFQLVSLLNWITIPATVAASYIILGLLFIGREIEDPFGQDVNDLPLDGYCEQIASELDIIASYDMQNPDGFLFSHRNMPLYPVSTASAASWMQRSEDKLRQTIKAKPATTFEWRKQRLHQTKNPGGRPSDDNV
ncbi:uncharacterized protein UV8b_03473 [Ustilaginoidea virens]|uniref:Uncharacterized protein n=1 Tax=Ustilaginoidea virens TaxID=1159556 RepID=A0A063C0B1_USTVR|nr:uncharacterized protein UV8b_03473 [Ustilaginoidea virens]QUC19232.1 hypothetical protein UV8b_03473 [Ustilaginoidea virens]GAO13093.1 hypothetical protein UVI_02024550 [Ustilaginoidea virens]